MERRTRERVRRGRRIARDEAPLLEEATRRRGPRWLSVYVWLLDSDIVIGDPAEIARTAALVGASILQPAVLPQHHGKFRANRSRCGAEATSFVEMQAPLFEASLWTSFHAQVLSRIPDHVLRDSDRRGGSTSFGAASQRSGAGAAFSRTSTL